MSLQVPLGISPRARRRGRWFLFQRLFAAITARGEGYHLDQPRDHSQSLPGEIAAFEHFFRLYESRITSYLWRMTGDEQIAHDLSQETFLRAWEHFAEISTYAAPAAWLFRVATNLALGHLRRGMAAVGAGTPLLEDLAVAGSDPIEQVVERDLIVQTLMCLQPRPRALLVMREIYGLSTVEAGHALGMTQTAARKMLNRAHQQFRQYYLHKEGCK